MTFGNITIEITPPPGWEDDEDEFSQYERQFEEIGEAIESLLELDYRFQPLKKEGWTLVVDY